MERLISGLWWAVIIGIGAFIGIMLFSQNPDQAIRTAMGTFICAFFLGLFLEVPGSKRGKDSAKRVIDWNFVAKWSVGFSIFLFGFMCMTARDTGIRAYNLGAINNQQISWTAVEQKIIPQVFIGGIVSFLLLVLTFAILTLWAYFIRGKKDKSLDQVQKETKLGLNILFGFSAVVGLMLLYYALVGNKSYMFAVEAIAVVALAYLVRSQAMLITCYVLLVAFLYLLVKYSIAIEGNRLLVLSLNSAAVYTWITSCSLWKTKPFFNFQWNKSKSANVMADSIKDKFYKVAYDEITISRADPVLWAKAFTLAEGNQDKAKALYIKYRVEQLSALPVQQPQVVSPASSTELPTHHEVAGSVYGENKSAIAIIVVVGLAGIILLLTQIDRKPAAANNPPQKQEVASQKSETTSQSVATTPSTPSRLPFEPEMVHIAYGCFQMGSPQREEGHQSNEQQHRVCLQDFEIGRYEVTQQQWQSVMGNNPSKFQGCPNCPVENISWNEIQDYLGRLNQQTRKAYRLPTEAEWEYACRGGVEGQRYCGGNDIDPLAWYSDNSGSKTHLVGQKTANGFGLYDMTGNVLERTCSVYDEDYGGAEKICPNSTGSPLSMRGGGWVNPPAWVRSAIRYWSLPAARGPGTGFRLARSL